MKDWKLPGESLVWLLNDRLMVSRALLNHLPQVMAEATDALAQEVWSSTALAGFLFLLLVFHGGPCLLDSAAHIQDGSFPGVSFTNTYPCYFSIQSNWQSRLTITHGFFK
jgi:hypothetical protein